MSVFKEKDQDDGATRIDVVDVPEGISIQLTPLDFGDYVSVILGPDKMRALLVWLNASLRRFDPPAPALPKVAMLQLDEYDDAHFIAHAIGCALALDIYDAKEAAIHATECTAVNRNADRSQKIVNRVAKLASVLRPPEDG